MSGRGVEDAVEQIRVDEDLARQVVAAGAPALGAFDLTDAEATAVVDALRLDLGVRGDDDDVEGFSLSFGMPLDNLIGVGRQLGVQNLGGPQAAGWIQRNREGWIERGGPGGQVL
jgi:hypothetical protein